MRRSRWNLTARELEVLTLVTAGYYHDEIALKLAIKVKTVNSHVDRIKMKLFAENTHEASIIAFRKNLFSMANIPDKQKTGD